MVETEAGAVTEAYRCTKCGKIYHLSLYHITRLPESLAYCDQEDIPAYPDEEEIVYLTPLQDWACFIALLVITAIIWAGIMWAGWALGGWLEIW